MDAAGREKERCSREEKLKDTLLLPKYAAC